MHLVRIPSSVERYVECYNYAGIELGSRSVESSDENLRVGRNKFRGEKVGEGVREEPQKTRDRHLMSNRALNVPIKKALKISFGYLFQYKTA